MSVRVGLCPRTVVVTQRQPVPTVPTHVCVWPTPVVSVYVEPTPVPGVRLTCVKGVEQSFSTRMVATSPIHVTVSKPVAGSPVRTCSSTVAGTTRIPVPEKPTAMLTPLGGSPPAVATRE